MSDKRLITSVEAAAQFLDKQHPGWASKIDLNSLNMFEWNNCILGQLYGDYTKAISKLSLSGDPEQSAFGVYADVDNWRREIHNRRLPHDKDDGEVAVEYNKLQRLKVLKREITEREEEYYKLKKELGI